MKTITDKDSESCSFTYDTNNLLTTAPDVDGYKLDYTYLDGVPKRIGSVTERNDTAEGDTLDGGTLTYTWRNGRELASMSDGLI